MRVTQENIIYLSRFLTHIKRTSACVAKCKGCIWKDEKSNECKYNEVEGVITDLIKQAKKNIKNKGENINGKDN